MPPSPKGAPLRFWDSSKHRSWLSALAVAEMVLEDPSVLKGFDGPLDRLRAQPHSKAAVEAWDEVLTLPPIAFARRITELSPRGEFLRDAWPPGGLVIPPDDILAIGAVRRDHEARGIVAYDCGA